MVAAWQVLASTACCWASLCAATNFRWPLCVVPQSQRSARRRREGGRARACSGALGRWPPRPAVEHDGSAIYFPRGQWAEPLGAPSALGSPLLQPAPVAASCSDFSGWQGGSGFLQAFETCLFSVTSLRQQGEVS